MENKKTASKVFRNIITYLPVAIILLSITFMIASTLAYFSDQENRDSNLSFGKVQLSEETNVGVSGTIYDAIPGTKLIDGAISFSKSTESQPIFVRAKISFSNDSGNPDMDAYVEALRNSEEFGIIYEIQNSNAVWSEKEGNYYYLLTQDKSAFKAVNTTDTYILTNEMVIPRDLKQLNGNAQYMESVNFHVAFQAIQVANVEQHEVKDLFNEIFPESESEKLTYRVEINSNNGAANVTTKIEVGATMQAPETPIKDGFTFDGWYAQDGSVNGQWGEKLVFPLTINANTKIYARWTEGGIQADAIVNALNGYGTYSYGGISFNISVDGDILLVGNPQVNLGAYTLEVELERIEVNLHDYIEYSYGKYVTTISGGSIYIFQIQLYNAQDEVVANFYTA